MAVFRSPEGVPASYHATWTEWKGYRTFVEVNGDNGMARGAYAPMQNLLIVNENGGQKKVHRFYQNMMTVKSLRAGRVRR